MPPQQDETLRETTVNIPANQDKTNTGVTLAAFEYAVLRPGPGHIWHTHPSGPGDWHGAAGKGPAAAGNHPWPGASEGCMIAWAGGNRVAHFRNNDELVVDAQGPLFLGPNDNHLRDNQGHLPVKITVKRRRQ